MNRKGYPIQPSPSDGRLEQKTDSTECEDIAVDKPAALVAHTCSFSRGETATVGSALDFAFVLACSMRAADDDDLGARVA